MGLNVYVSLSLGNSLILIYGQKKIKKWVNCTFPILIMEHIGQF